MKKINNAYITPAKENLFDEISSQHPELVGGYAILSNLPIKIGTELLKRTSECDEDLHPLMYSIIDLLCINPPIESVSFLLEREAHGEQRFYLMLPQMLEQLEAWIHENREQVEILSSMCPGSKVIDLEDGYFAMEDFYVTPEVEKAFLIEKKQNETQKERTLRLKRDKLISAVAALMSYKNIEIFETENRIDQVKIFSFTLACHLVRFSAGFSIADGISRQMKRRKGGEKGPDREGLLAMLRKFNEQHPAKGPTELWKIIVSHLIKQKKYRLLKNYTLHFEIEPTDTSETGGKIIQIRSGKKEQIMQFQAFADTLRDIRK